MSALHTPGPWIACEPTKELHAVRAGIRIVANAGYSGSVGTDIANARLIAAAPDLLEALKLIADVSGWAAVAIARAAIAKAEAV